ncbi:LRR receptor-like serine/threonine-protein kinase SIK1 isoform X2 [Magnolia sinica]|uniref:LRR receptor-like serine/threonine-protein kinase SIK1 isoform X2 n=1 Tax=Magnolia sinica TaxID=86752 RepID=UPI0026593AC7|nr:LRR receptor-like serine/threonine-protein kinase SIK1 isoform X2 [Magnolia sinica]
MEVVFMYVGQLCYTKNQAFRTLKWAPPVRWPTSCHCSSSNDFRQRDLKGNQLTGSIPDEISNCILLKSLYLSSNLLYGDIPFSTSRLKQFEELTLKNYQLTGPIPSTLSQMPNLKTLDLAQNQLTGDIPMLIYWNEVLQYLGLRGNLLTGTLSPDMCLCDVRGNNLSGSIPDNIGNCTRLMTWTLLSMTTDGNIRFLDPSQDSRTTGQ